MSDIKIETLAVIIKTTDNRIFQVGLIDSQIEQLKIDLRDYFPNGIIKIMPDELTNISIGENPNFKNKKENE